ncbi:MAG TPA: helix-turn-helix transcriptional regulator [Blastocatellia bacterium]|nr:helix-turn-helix transcriptional regulator [Blastocatellia bacterium]
MNDYLCRLRVDAARQALLAGVESMAQIAVACGFYDQAHLIKSFKQYFGITPGEYRKKHWESR